MTRPETGGNTMIGTIKRSWTGVDVNPDEAYCTCCGWVRAATDADDAVRKANDHDCPNDPDDVFNRV